MRNVRLATVILVVLMWIFLYLQNLAVFFVFVVGVLYLLCLDVFSLKKCKKILFKIKRNFVNPVSPPSFLKIDTSASNSVVSLLGPIISINQIKKVQGILANKITRNAPASGAIVNPDIVSQRTLAYTIFGILVTIPLTALLVLLFGAIALVLIFVPCVVLFYPIIKLRIKISERKSTVEDEIAFFSVYCAVMQMVRRSLHESISKILGRNVFVAIEREGTMQGRNVSLFGMDHMSGLNTLASWHPSFQFRNFLLGYVSIHKSGGDLQNYLESKSEEFLNDAKFKFFKYASSAETISEVMLILFGMLPMLLVLSAFLMNHDSLYMIISSVYVLVPVVGVVIFLVIDKTQPKTHNIIAVSPLPLVFGVAFAVISFLLAFELWLIFAGSIITSCIINFVITRKQFGEIAMHENSLADFFREVTEYRKIGINITEALLRITEERNFNKFFNKALRDISSTIAFGVSMSDAIRMLKIRSWYTRISFFMLEKIIESGGASPQILEYLTNFFSKINQAKSQMSLRIKIFAYIAYFSPILMVWSTYSMRNLLDKITPKDIQLGGLIQAGLTPEYFQLVNMLVVICCLTMGVTVSKLAFFTIKHTFSTALILVVAVVTIYLVPLFPIFY